MDALDKQTEKNTNIQLVVFRLGGQEFGVNIEQVREIIRIGGITSLPGSHDYIDGIINLRGQITRVINLRTKFGMERKKHDEMSRIMIIETDIGIVGIIVDSVAEVKYLSNNQVEQVPDYLSTEFECKYLMGVGKLPGRLLIITDLRRMLDELNIMSFTEGPGISISGL